MKKLKATQILQARNILLIIILLFAGYSYSFSQTVELKGRVIDADNQNPLCFAIVLLENNGEIITGGTTDINGIYHLKVSHPGEYNLILNYIDYQPKLIAGVTLPYGETQFFDCEIANKLYSLETASIPQEGVRIKENTL